MGLRKIISLLARAISEEISEQDKKIAQANIAKGERSERYTRDPEIIATFKQIWDTAAFKGALTHDDTTNFSQARGPYKMIFNYKGEANVNLTLHRAGTPGNHDYEEFSAKQNGHWLENGRAVTLRSGWLKVYAVYNSHQHPAFLRFDRGNAESLLKLKAALQP